MTADSNVAPHRALVAAMPRAELARLCKIFGASLTPDLAGTDDGSGKPIDGARLLWAISGRESSFGKNMTPRHEPAYDVGGLYWRTSEEVKQGVGRYGRDFACSYGPLQIMACNASGHTPEELGSDPEAALGAAVAHLKIIILYRQMAKTIAEICQCWNGGHIGARTTPGYVGEVMRHYQTAGFDLASLLDGQKKEGTCQP